MPNVLDVDGPAYRALSRWTELARLTLAWWLLSLPVITAPVATDWLMHSVRRTRAGEDVPGIGETWRYVRGRFFVGLRLAGLQLGTAALVAAALLGPSPGGWYGQLVLGVAALVGTCWMLVAPWSTALLEQHDSATAAVRIAYRLAIRQLSLAFLSAVTVLVAAGILLSAPAWMRVIAIVAVPGVTAALVTWLCDLAVARTRPTREPSSDTPGLDDHRLEEATR